MPAEIDVVIPTRDRPGPLAACLGALASQTFTGFRVVVVDDASSPLVAGDAAGLPPDRLLLVRNLVSLGPAASRNRGVEAGSAPIVLFLDDDVRPAPELVARHHAALTGRPGAAVSLGPLLPPPGQELAPWDRWEADRLAREYARLARGDVQPSWTHLYTGNAAVRRDDFLAVGGFDTTLPRQHDLELGYRLAARGCTFLFEPDAVAWHLAARTLAEWLELPRASAQGDAMMARLRPESGRLAAVAAERRSRRLPLRIARRLLGPRAVRPLAVRAATTAGRALDALGATRLALPAFSVAWDLEYGAALAAATDAAQPEG